MSWDGGSPHLHNWMSPGGAWGGAGEGRINIVAENVPGVRPVSPTSGGSGSHKEALLEELTLLLQIIWGEELAECPSFQISNDGGSKNNEGSVHEEERMQGYMRLCSS